MLCLFFLSPLAYTKGLCTFAQTFTLYRIHTAHIAWTLNQKVSSFIKSLRGIVTCCPSPGTCGQACHPSQCGCSGLVGVLGLPRRGQRRSGAGGTLTWASLGCTLGLPCGRPQPLEGEQPYSHLARLYRIFSLLLTPRSGLFYRRVGGSGFFI